MKTLNSRRTARRNAQASIVKRKRFSADEVLKHVDPGTPEEAEEFVRLIYERRRQDLARTSPR